MIRITITNDQSELKFEERLVKEAVRMILNDRAVSRAEVSVAVVDDATICELHRKHLGRDEPTDVLSFPLERSEDYLEGEVIVSAETAAVTAPWFDWPAQNELLLYVVHGTLHLVGYDDATPEKQAEMREQEAQYLDRLGLPVRTAKAKATGRRRAARPEKSPKGGKKSP